MSVRTALTLAAAGGAALAGLALAGCDSSALDPMRDQPALRGMESTPLFADGRSLRTPPAGTVPQERRVGPHLVTRGYEETASDAGGVPLGPALSPSTIVAAAPITTTYADRAPYPVTIEFLREGRRRYEIVCATCHGITGNGESIVARQFELRAPPSLLTAPIRDYPVGRIFRIASEGFGMMPAFAEELPLEERWAIAAYVKALQWSQAAPVGDLSADERAQVER